VPPTRKCLACFWGADIDVEVVSGCGAHIPMQGKDTDPRKGERAGTVRGALETL
jgi:hypothetical protein